MEAFNGKKIFVTGAAGFIGWNLSKRLLKESADITVIGVDNMNDYYDVSIKEYRLKELEQFPNFTFVKADISDKAVVQVLFQIYRPDIVVNLAAQAGVRYSITNPDAYVNSNLDGFFRRGETIRIFNYGNCKRDFTYVDDIVEGVVRVMQKAPYRTARGHAEIRGVV